MRYDPSAGAPHWVRRSFGFRAQKSGAGMNGRRLV